MGKTTTIFGNYLYGGSVTIEKNLTLERVHDLLNGWRNNIVTNELERKSNETIVKFLDNGLVLFNHRSKDCENQSTPNLVIENNYIYGGYIIARMNDGDFIDLTAEDIEYLEGCYTQILILRKAINDKLAKEYQENNKNG